MSTTTRYPLDPEQTIRKDLSKEEVVRIPTDNPPPQITSLLARGGMGTIYEAEQAYPRRTVVVKKADHNADYALKRGLIQEAMIMGALDHPNIIPVHQILLMGRIL